MKLVSKFEDIQLGNIIHNEDCGNYVVIAINPDKDITLLLKEGTENPDYTGAWGLEKKENGNYFWHQGHYFGNNLKSAIEYLENGTEKVQKKVWLVHTDRCIRSGGQSSDVFVYATYDIAKREFDKIVNEDKIEHFKGYDEEDSSYTHEEDDNYWCIWEEGYYCETHSLVKIEEHIIEEE